MVRLPTPLCVTRPQWVKLRTTMSVLRDHQSAQKWPKLFPEPCRHWWHWGLSKWQPPLPPVTTSQHYWNSWFAEAKPPKHIQLMGQVRWGCLVTRFCYQMIAKPGNKTAALPSPDSDIILGNDLVTWGDRESPVMIWSFTEYIRLGCIGICS